MLGPHPPVQERQVSEVSEDNLATYPILISQNLLKTHDLLGA
jgi:hypothetical protein